MHHKAPHRCCNLQTPRLLHALHGTYRAGLSALEPSSFLQLTRVQAGVEEKEGSNGEPKMASAAGPASHGFYSFLLLLFPLLQLSSCVRGLCSVLVPSWRGTF